MVRAILDGALLPPLTAVRLPDSRIQLLDGHHRACAYWFAGRRTLGWGDYILLEELRIWRPSRGLFVQLLERERMRIEPLDL